MRTLTVGAAAVAAAVVLSATPEAEGAAGDLDPSFGNGGIVVSDIYPEAERGQAIALQEDGKIVVSGTRFADDELTVLRYNPDGSLDTTFSGDGSTFALGVSRGNDVIVRDDGKIVVAGEGDMHLARFNSDGGLDAGFGAGGVTGSQFFNPDDQDETYPPEMVRLIEGPGNSVIVAGTIDYGPYFFTFAKYDDNGVLDDSFGDDGQVQTDFTAPDDGADQEPFALVPYDGGFLAAGGRDVDDNSSDYATVIAKYDANGELDDSFGDDGKTTMDLFEFDDQIEELLPLEDGRILAIGTGTAGLPMGGADYQVFVMSFDPDGTATSTFGNDGVIIYPMEGQQEVHGAALMEDGKILIAGDWSDQQHDIFLMRLNPDGSLDQEFGDGGVSIVSTLPGNFELLNDIVVAEDGAIYGTGSVNPDSLGVAGGGGGAAFALFKFKSTAGVPRLMGDVDCSGGVSATDALALLRSQAGLPVQQEDPCPEIGEVVDIEEASPHPWGDVDCSGGVSATDALALLRSQAGLPVQQEDSCPDIGEEILVSE
jgi:uncharacterized delta-60 repeat protein